MPLFTPSSLSSLQSSPGLLEGIFPSPSDIPSKEFPVQLQIAFNGSELVSYGNKLPISVVSHFPTTVNFVGEEGKGYTLVLADPDAPSAATPTSRSFLHLIKSNLVPLPASAFDALGSSGVDVENPSIVSIPQEDLMPWRAPGPGPNSGPHRYVFFLLEQPAEKVSFAADHLLRNGAPEGRRHFDVSKFSEQHLGGGKIVGVNWFVVEAEKA